MFMQIWYTGISADVRSPGLPYPMHIMEDTPKEHTNDLKMHWLKRSIMIMLIIYLLYACTSTLFMIALRKPKDAELTTESYKVHMDRAALIESGSGGAQVRLDLIEAAQTSIDFTYYTISNGQFTDVLFSCLLAAADRGVQVRILQEGLTSFAYERGKLKKTLRSFATHPNIEVRYYEKISLFRPWAWDARLHEKMILVDGELALIGGRNIGNKYLLKEEYKSRYVHDRDALICRQRSQDSVIDEMITYFDQLWQYKHTKPRKKVITDKQIEQENPTLETIRSYNKQVKSDHPHLFQEQDWKGRTYPTQGIRFVHNSVGSENREPWCLRALLLEASKAQTSIFLQSPYIIPSKAMRKVIAEYDIDWLKVTVMTNSKQASPNVIAMAAYYNHRKNIVDRVGSLYEYQGPPSIHSKSYVFDDTTSIVGTFNLDSRSSYINTESMVIITSMQFASTLNDAIQTTMDNSARVHKDYTYGGEAEDRSPAWLFSKFVRLFEYYL